MDQKFADSPLAGSPIREDSDDSREARSACRDQVVRVIGGGTGSPIRYDRRPDCTRSYRSLKRFLNPDTGMHPSPLRSGEGRPNSQLWRRFYVVFSSILLAFAVSAFGRTR